MAATIQIDIAATAIGITPERLHQLASQAERAYGGPIVIRRGRRTKQRLLVKPMADYFSSLVAAETEVRNRFLDAAGIASGDGAAEFTD